MPKPGLSVSDKLLVAATKLEESGSCPFSAEDLVVAAWRTFPETFGLRGHPDEKGVPLYPDSNRVFAEIMGSKPVRKRGFLVKVGQKMYKVTESGHQKARGLGVSSGGNIGAGEAKKTTMRRDVEVEIRRLLASRAVQKVDSHQEESLTFYDACVFWGITPQSKAIELEGRLSLVADVIVAAMAAVKDGKARFQHGGQVFSQGSVALLQQTHEILKSNFSEQVSAIMKRTDQRRR
jgi:hypothetical protein